MDVSLNAFPLKTLQKWHKLTENDETIGIPVYKYGLIMRANTDQHVYALQIPLKKYKTQRTNKLDRRAKRELSKTNPPPWCIDWHLLSGSFSHGDDLVRHLDGFHRHFHAGAVDGALVRHLQRSRLLLLPRQLNHKPSHLLLHEQISAHRPEKNSKTMNGDQSREKRRGEAEERPANQTNEGVERDFFFFLFFSFFCPHGVFSSSRVEPDALFHGTGRK